jgi:hypothetical protein
MAETIIRVRGGQAGIGSLSGQSTELSENINPVALGKDITQNIVNSQASLSTNVQDNKYLLGNAETFSKAQSSMAAVAVGFIAAGKIGTALSESTSGFETAATLAGAGATALGLAAAFATTGVGLLVSGAIVLSQAAQPLRQLGQIQRQSREAQFLANRQSVRIDKR